MPDLLGIDIKTLYDGGFQFYQTGFIRKVLEATGMEHCYGLPTPTKVDVPIGTDDNGSEANIDWPNSYASAVGMMLYLESNTISDIYFAVHQCAGFTDKTNASYDKSVNRICRYLQGTNNKGLVFNLSKKLVVNCYAYAYFTGM